MDDSQNSRGGHNRRSEHVAGPESSVELVRRAHDGDREAMERLCARYLEPLRHWATGRLPPWARGLLDTDDLVQESLSATVRNIATFEPGREGTFHAYLRLSLKNKVRDAIKAARRSPRVEALNDEARDTRASPLDGAIGAEMTERYERALAGLRADEREAVVARIEFGLSYREVAEAVGKSSSDAARMMVSRALLGLAREIGHGR